MNVPLLDLQGQYLQLKSELDEAVSNVVSSQYFILGPEVSRFEEEIANYLDVQHALGVSSGTDALLLALMALGVKAGDEVILPTFSFFATAGVVARMGAIPRFVDVDPVTYNIDPSDIEGAISSKTGAIIPVHLYGQSAAMDEIISLGKRHGVPVVEDAAQSIGAAYSNGAALGTIGTVGCFSFFPSKNLGAFGDAGMVTTNDGELYEKMKLMRVHGAARAYTHEVVGGNFRIDAMQAAVLSVKLPHLNEWSRKRAENANLYRKLFVERGLSDLDEIYPTSEQPVALPRAVVPDGERPGHIYNQFVVRVNDREGLMERLREEGIGHSVYYPIPFHRQPCFLEFVAEGEEFPAADRASEEVLALPIFPELSIKQMTRVADVIAGYYRS